MAGKAEGFLSFFGFKNLVILASILSAGGAAYLSVKSYINTNKETIQSLNVTITELEKHLQRESSNNRILQENQKTLIENQKSLDIQYSKIHSSVVDLLKREQFMIDNYMRLHEKLYRESRGKKSIEELGAAKPGLVQKYINKEILRLNECVKRLTGGEKNEKFDCTDFGV